MKRLVLLVLLSALAVPNLAFGQEQTAPPQKPGPEVQRLGYFVGTWNFVGEAMTDPKDKYEGTATWAWFPGGFSVVNSVEGTGVADGPVNKLEILGYSVTDKTYTWYTVTRNGAGRAVLKWSVDGKVWTCEEASAVSGKPAKRRYTITEVSPTSYSYKIDRSIEGGPWTQTFDLKATKVK
jgi:Protein of unknown function (DUF1579)